ncbi:glycosyltransferase family 2 protein [Paeniglutamicibacter psychrophenolicus]|uniref:ABC-type taurine transport system ATPase subunit n=1 Tax=Paeniglutamicibacter psychrophenolicus TaxID=257454 RepID=A0ABS4W8X1_9MICC|nr:glycosyltransferase family 2 protein [Paeniglutamicibacter psychrophenolicus]MBP2372625.1 ABC-type taurine transport system ATPase subunit [Paeniglutamicibacter psychrophenolicus]
MPSTSERPSAKARIPGRISVIVPAMNQQDFIGDTLASLARQRLGARELEVLVIDDASTDATAAIAGQFASGLPGLRIITHPANRGVSAARNTGLENASGEFVVFLDPDDWFAPNHLAQLADGLEELDVDYVRCDHVRVTGGNRTLYRAPQANRNVVLDPTDDISPIHTATMIDYPLVWAGMYRAEMLSSAAPRFNEELRTCEDRPWFWELALKAKSYAVLNAHGIFYRRGLPGSLTQVFDDRQLDFLDAFAGILDMVLGDPAHEAHGPKALRQFIAISCHHLGRSAQFPPALRRSLREGIAERLAVIPAPLLDDGLAQIDAKRRKTLTGLLPSAAAKGRSK